MIYSCSISGSGRRRVGLLGGSFNPAHEGHKAISLYALKRLGLDAVWWLVSPQNPLKEKQGMADYRDRLKTAASVADNPRIIVTDLEQRLGTFYTIDTVTTLCALYPDIDFVWLMGSDNLRQFHRWRDWLGIAATLPIAVFRRPGYGAGRKMGKAAQRLDRYWLPTRAAPQLAKMIAPAWLMLDNPLDQHSATAIRKGQTKWPPK